ncbi:MAG TPA: hypothetical protein VFS89_00770, partial [Nitrosospira sp.]|nr:hypothetical protein [Nitrosospira sp.]
MNKVAPLKLERLDITPLEHAAHAGFLCCPKKPLSLMHLHLLIPSLFWPEPSLTGIYHDLSLPALEGLLSKSTVTESEPQEVEAWLCDAFGIEKQQDWPVAPITLKVDGTENGPTDSGYWLRADPVHLHIEHDQI